MKNFLFLFTSFLLPIYSFSQIKPSNETLCHVSRNPVIRRIEFLTSLKSLPFRVLPYPVQTENAITFPAIRRPIITWGGSISPSSPPSSSTPRRAESTQWNQETFSGIFTGSDGGEVFFLLLNFFLFGCELFLINSPGK